MELEKRVMAREEYKEPNGNGEVSNTSSENIFYPIDERRFTKDQYLSILEGAEFLREFDAQRKTRINSLALKLSDEEQNVPLSRIYGLAQDLGIDRQYVDKYLEQRFPSEEQKLKDLKRFNASLDFRPKANFYKIKLLEVLNKTFPNEEFYANVNHNDYAGISRIVFLVKKQKIVKKGIFRKKEVVEYEMKNIALLKIFNNKYSLDLYDPCFLRACGDKLDQFNKSFDIEESKVVSHYMVDPTK